VDAFGVKAREETDQSVPLRSAEWREDIRAAEKKEDRRIVERVDEIEGTRQNATQDHDEYGEMAAIAPEEAIESEGEAKC